VQEEYEYLKFCHPVFGTYLRALKRWPDNYNIYITNSLLIVEKSPTESYSLTYGQMDDNIYDLSEQFVSKNKKYRIFSKKRFE